MELPIEQPQHPMTLPTQESQTIVEETQQWMDEHDHLEGPEDTCADQQITMQPPWPPVDEDQNDLRISGEEQNAPGTRQLRSRGLPDDVMLPMINHRGQAHIQPLSREELTAICQEWYDLSEGSEAIIGATVKLSQTVKTEDRPQQPEPQNEAQPTTQKTTGQRKPDRRTRSPVSPSGEFGGYDPNGVSRARRSSQRHPRQREPRPSRGDDQGNQGEDRATDNMISAVTKPQDTSTQPFHWTTRTYKNSKRNSRGQGKIDRNIFALNQMRGLSTKSLGTTSCSRAAVASQERGGGDTRMDGVTGWHARSPAGHFRFQTKPVRHDSLPRELESEGTHSHHSPDTFPLRRPKATLS